MEHKSYLIKVVFTVVILHCIQFFPITQASTFHISQSSPTDMSSESFFSSRYTQDLEGLVHPSVYSRFKRAIDVGGSIVGLCLTGLVLIPIAISIRIEDGGPILFSQTRVGLDGKPFRIWKFRSMVVNAERLRLQIKNEANGQMFKSSKDSRVTRTGKFLRRTSLDEFPQFWNVLVGDMSLVGTRPPTTNEVLNYDAHHFKRLRVKPGITGEWQVRGRSQIKDFEEVVELDLDYQKKWSEVYDLWLIIKTVGVVIAGKGSY